MTKHAVKIHFVFDAKTDKDLDDMYDKCIDFFEHEMKIPPEDFTMGSELE